MGDKLRTVVPQTRIDADQTSTDSVRTGPVPAFDLAILLRLIWSRKEDGDSRALARGNSAPRTLETLKLRLIIGTDAFRQTALLNKPFKDSSTVRLVLNRIVFDPSSSLIDCTEYPSAPEPGDWKGSFEIPIDLIKPLTTVSDAQVFLSYVQVRPSSQQRRQDTE